jgi:DNA-binding MarR family transcriptional regulator
MASTHPIQSDEISLYKLIHDIYVYLDNCDCLTLEKFELTPTQFRLLSLIDSKKGQRITALSGRLLLSKSQVTRIVDILVNNGLVQRTTDPLDRRAKLIVLTKSGQLLRDKLIQEHQNSLINYFDVFDNDEFETLIRLLNSLKQSMKKYLDR